MDENLEFSETKLQDNDAIENINLEVSVKGDDKNSPNESGDDSPNSIYSDKPQTHSDLGSENGTDVDENEGSVVLERQDGDGQESIPQKPHKVDDDEDKKNPQYIPKRGTFYEHDDRTADDIEAEENEEKEKIEKEGKKKLWQEKKERWSHDRFNDQEQAPKSKSELIQIYGYDIRNEDGPPRARRRRRYGRGPNKYTRNWKDEDAYNKSVSQKPQKKTQKPLTQSSEEFPPLVEVKDEESNEIDRQEPEPNVERNTSPNELPNTDHAEERKEIVQKEKSSNSERNKQPEQSSVIENKTPKWGGRVSKSRVANYARHESPDSTKIDVSEYKGFTTITRMGRNFKNQNNIINKQQKNVSSQGYSNKREEKMEQRVDNIENAMSHMNIQETRVPEKGSQNRGQNRQSGVPPRMQSEQKSSKRYSSIRQRSLPESNNPQVMQHQSYFQSDLNQSQQPAASVIHQNPNLLQTPASITQLGAPPSMPMTQQVPAANTGILQAPPQFAAPYPQPTAFISAPVPPPTFLQQQAPPILNYVQAPPQYPAGFQAFPYQQAQSTELYQPQGGITYYSTDQQIAQRTVPPKRPKAAIPIVAPPSSEMKRIDDERKSEYPTDSDFIE